MATAILLRLLLGSAVVWHSSSGHELLEMTHTFDNGSLFWPNGQASFQMTILSLGETGNGYWYQDDEFTSGSHLGTHLDAPNHFSKDKWAADEIPIAHLVARPAAVIDIRQKAAQSSDVNVTVEDIRRYELTHGMIPNGAVVFQCAGWSAKYPDKLAVFGNDRDDATDFHFPSFGVNAVEWLIEKRDIVGIAVDTPSVDYGQSATYPVHVHIGLHNVYGLENVKDTCTLPPAGAAVYVFPFKMRGASGAPVRIIASWDNTPKDDTSGYNHVSAASYLMITVGLVAIIASKNLHHPSSNWL